MQKGKKIFALILAVVIVLSNMSLTLLGEEYVQATDVLPQIELETASPSALAIMPLINVPVSDFYDLRDEIEGASGFVTIVVENDITMTEAIRIFDGADIVLVSNGSPVTLAVNGSFRHFIVEEGGILTLGDGGLGDNITLTRDDMFFGVGGGVRVDAGGEFIMYGGTISENDAGTGGTGNGGGVYTRGWFSMHGGTISYNFANSGGGVGVWGWDATFYMSDGIISTNSANASGGGVAISQGDFTMSGGAISYNDANNNGGGVLVLSGGVFYIDGGEISGNIASSAGGGVLINPGGMLDMLGGTISGNEAFWGGGVFNWHEFFMSGGLIEVNVATQGGGVFNSASGYFEMNDNGEIARNSATFGGGVFNSGDFFMDGGTISGNLAFNGGGVYINDGEFEMAGGTISSNEAFLDGGGVYVADDSYFIMEDGTISGNIAEYGGGGVFVSYGTFTMDGGTIYDNEADEGGGVLIGLDSTFYMKNGSTISGNTALSSGGGVLNHGTFDMAGGVIEDNDALTGGGVTNRSQGDFLMTGGEISGNMAEHHGGGVFNSGDFIMDGGEISDNEATITDAFGTTGGGVFNNGTFTMYDGYIVRNEAGDGGGVTNYVQGEFIMEGGTISDNYAGNLGGGVWNWEIFTMNGGIIYGNDAHFFGHQVWNNRVTHTFNFDGGEVIGTIYPYTVIIYRANSGIGTMRNGIIIDGDDYIVSANSFTKATYAFIGWNTQADGSGTDFAPGDAIYGVMYALDKYIELFAQWMPAPCTCTTENDGGNCIICTCTDNDCDAATPCTCTDTYTGGNCTHCNCINNDCDTAISCACTTENDGGNCAHCTCADNDCDAANLPVLCTCTGNGTCPPDQCTCTDNDCHTPPAPTPDPSVNYAWLSTNRATFDIASPQDIAITLNSGDFSFRNIRFGNLVLVRDRDFTVSGNRITINAEFLTSLEPGQRRLTFEMSGGTNPTLTVTVTDSTPTPVPTPSLTPEPIPTPAPTPIPLPFTDVSLMAWYYPYVRIVWQTNLFQGISPNTFDPQGGMTRAMFVQVLANLENANLSAYMAQNYGIFNDIDADAWYFPAVEWAARQGLVNGIGDGSFAPHRPITREEMAVLLHRYIKDIALPTGLALPFTDQAHISPWAVYAVMEIKAAGIITGHPDGSFAPQASATRADAAAIFSRFLISK